MQNFQSTDYTLNSAGLATVNIQGLALAYQSGATPFLTFVADDGTKLKLTSGQGQQQVQNTKIVQLRGCPTMW